MSTALMIALAIIGIMLLGAVSTIILVYRTNTKAVPIPELAEETKYKDEEEHKLPSTLPTAITSSQEDVLRRDQWVLRMTRYVFSERHPSQHNVVVINNDIEYHFSSDTIIEEFSVKYREGRRTIPYRIIVFREGELVNLGEGGDINWDWMGNFIRHNDAMVTFKPCKPGAKYKQDPWAAVE